MKEFTLARGNRTGWWIAVSLAIIAGVVIGCGTNSPSVATSPTGTIGAPTITAPTDDQQLDTVKPTLTVSNAGGSGPARTYDFQLADNAAFSPVAVSKLSVPEGSGTTSITLTTDLQPSTRYYWRVRLVAGGTASDWVIGKFRTKVGGYNRAGELFDPLIENFTIGERFGNTTFVSGKGIRLGDTQSYVRYQLPQTISSGEFSMEVEGLAPNGPGPKLNIFSMAQSTGTVTGNSYEATVQYRGAPGNPDNCISFKAVWGSSAYKLEPDIGKRNDSVMYLNPTTTYYWQASWTANSFRVLVKAGGINGSVIYDYTINAAGGGPYAPSPHVAYLGSNAGALGTDTGSFAGATIRNVWLSSRPRPASLGAGTQIGR
ncbi:MAG TPA: hypothetical protein VGK32_04340 [Vicinamibacterales bacterium]|jgi:hypothetical protein